MKYALLLSSLLVTSPQAKAELLTQYEPPLIEGHIYGPAPENSLRVMCNPDLIVSAQIFVHDSVNSGRPWDDAAQQRVVNTINSEMQRVNQGYCDPSIGALKVQFTHSVTFITNYDFPVAGMNLGDVLNQFAGYWRSGAKNNGSDMGMVYVVNPDGGVGGISVLGADVATKNNNGGPALNWGWSNKGDVIAHEVGHFFDADHDGSGASASCPAKGDIMGGGARLTWSTCARDSIQRWLQSDRSFYFRKTSAWLKQLAQVGPLGGNGGDGFITGCSQGNYVTQVQPEIGNIGSYSSLIGLRFACSNGFSTLEGGRATVSLKPDSRFKMQGGGWLTGVDIDGQFIGNRDQDKGTMSCPAGTRIAGFFGRRGAALDNLGLLCMPSGTSGTIESLGPVGGAGTDNKFSLQCAAGHRVTHILGDFGDLLGDSSLLNIGIRCSDGQEKRAKSPVAASQSFAEPATSLQVYSGQWINGLAVGDALLGSVQHSSAELACKYGKSIAGIFGTYGAAIDNLGLYCF